MRRWPLLGTLLALLGGASIERSEAAARPPADPAATREAGAGYEGDGFYVWDEDPAVAESWAAELLGPPYPKRRS